MLLGIQRLIQLSTCGHHYLLTDMFAGVVFSPKLDGDTKPLCQQSQLSPDELREK